MIKINYLHYIQIAIVCLGLSYHLQGQSIKTFDDTLKIGSYAGKAQYKYQVINKNKIITGPFVWERFNLKDVLEGKDISFYVEGNFRNDYPEGSWKFEFNTFQSNKRNVIRNNRYVVNVKGYQRVAYGDIVEGKNSGTWTYMEQEIRDSEVDKVTFKSEIEFDRGVPIKNFRIEDHKSALVGRLLRNGLAHDQWTLYSDGELDVETWSFNEGMLEEIKTVSGETIKFLHSKSITQGNTRTVTLDQGYFDFLRFTNTSEKIEGFLKSNIQKLIFQHMHHYQRIDSILSTWSASPVKSGFKVRVPYYSLEEKDIKLWKRISERYEAAKKIEKEIQDNTKLTILRLSDEETANLEASMDKISKNSLFPIRELVALHAKGVTSYIPTKELLTRVFMGKIHEIKEIAGNSTIINIDDTDIHTIAQVEELTEQIFLELKAIQEKLNKKVAKQIQQKELLTIEEKLVARLKGIESLKTESIKDSIPEEYISAITGLHIFAKSKLGAYGSIKNLTKKIDFAKTLDKCFENLAQISKEIKNIPEQKSEVINAYQDDIWNPFTATLMNSGIKKRITEAYVDILIPYFIGQIEANFDCEITVSWLEKVRLTHKRLNEMITEDTRKMERKLRKEKNPMVILEHFGVNTPN